MEKIKLNSAYGSFNEKKCVFVDKDYLIKILALAGADYVNENAKSAVDAITIIDVLAGITSTVVDLLFTEDIESGYRLEQILKLKELLGGNENENN